MKPDAFRATPVTGAIFAFLLTFSALPSFAQQAEMLRGKPSKEQILEALSPTHPAPPPRAKTRGLSLGPAANQAPAPAPAPVAEQESASSVRALDLEIQFSYNSDALTQDGRDVLDQLGAALMSEQLSNPNRIILEGHTDASGSDVYNQILSFRRASSVLKYLSALGVPAGKMRAVGKGESELADPDHPDDAINRRVRIIVEG